jgi:pilus assembly protein CpaC
LDIDIFIEASEQRGLTRVLAEPNLIALSGETASFLAGGEFPLPVVNDDGEVTVTFKEFGVRLAFTPIVLDDGLINLKLQPEVSELDFAAAVDTGAGTIPGLTVRRTTTTVELRDGQSFSIAGLLSSRNRKNQSQLPWVGQLPIIGTLFRSSSFTKNETDLVVIVTPRLVKPADPGKDLRTPLDRTYSANDPEFFLLGLLEVDKLQIRKFALGEGIVGPYGQILDFAPEAQVVVKP